MRCGIFNLGATGQLYIGAILGSLVGVRFAGMPAVLHIPLMLLAGFAGGGAVRRVRRLAAPPLWGQ